MVGLTCLEEAKADSRRGIEDTFFSFIFCRARFRTQAEGLSNDCSKLLLMAKDIYKGACVCGESWKQHWQLPSRKNAMRFLWAGWYFLYFCVSFNGLRFLTLFFWFLEQRSALLITNRTSLSYIRDISIGSFNWLVILIRNTKMAYNWNNLIVFSGRTCISIHLNRLRDSNDIVLYKPFSAQCFRISPTSSNERGI
jgi:hypothetical protein